MLNLIHTVATRMREREEGQTFVEYALLIGGVSLALLLVFTGLGPALANLVSDIASEINGTTS